MIFGTLPDGREVQKITIRNGDLSAGILTYGAILNEVRLDGVAHNLTLGSDKLDDYLGVMKYYGAIVGPVANRIKGARARIGGIEHMLTPNEGRNILHSANGGAHAKLWVIEDQTDATVTLSTLLPDGEAGFPGNQKVMVHFAALPDSTLRMEITATTDEDALINIVNHSYWTMSATPDYSGQSLQVHAKSYLPVDAETLPTGEVAEVDGTPFDFRQPQVLKAGDPALDNNWCLSRIRLPLRDVAVLKGDVTMTVATDMPGMQIFDGRNTHLAGFERYAGLAFEPQFWPNAPHESDFPRILFKAGEVWTQAVEWRFTR